MVRKNEGVQATTKIKRVRPKKTWLEDDSVWLKDMCNLTRRFVLNHAEWRERIHVVYPI